MTPRDRHEHDATTPLEGRSRRVLLRGILAGLAGLACPRSRAAQEENAKGAAHDDAEIARVREQAKAAGLGRFEFTKSKHFLALGDAALSFQREALAVCEALGDAFLACFRKAGFHVSYPPERLTVIVLKDEDSYARLQGQAPGKEVGGHYDLETNRLVIFDFRSRQGNPEGQAEQDNLLALVHETAHQLTFNTGMLDRGGNLPLAVLEGLATYVEVWRPRVRNGIGGVNLRRLEALRQSDDWIPVADLLADDKAFDPETEQLAYAESWLFVHYMLRSGLRHSRFRDYLSQAQAAKTRDQRLRVAERTLGSLERLEHELKIEGRKYLSR
ncbi:MAG: DUF1570 domain-containing protein [Isosphaeraceae bacterium]